MNPTPSASGSRPILRAYTQFHVILSLIGIVTGFVVIAGMIAGHDLPTWTPIFLTTTLATSVTGFFFPYTGFKPSYVFGILSCIFLGLAYAALYKHGLAGGWRTTYVVMAILSQYLNFFVLIVQVFQKVPYFNRLAPTQKEPPFAIAHVVTLIAFVVMGVLAVGRFS